MDPRGVFVALRRFQTASWGSYGLRRLSLSGFILLGGGGARNARNAVSAAESAQTHNCPSRRQKNAYRRFRREKKRFFSRL